MVTKRKPGRPKGSSNKPRTRLVISNDDLKELQEMTRKERSELERLKALVERQDEGIAQGLDQVDDLLKQVDFYRKQVNHLLALLNILSKGA